MFATLYTLINAVHQYLMAYTSTFGSCDDTIVGNAHFIREKQVDFWWNDEGETQFFTYEGWNRAQVPEFAAASTEQQVRSNPLTFPFTTLSKTKCVRRFF